MSPLLILILTLLIVYKLYRFAYDKPPNTPPGIIRLPIGGSYWMLLWGNYKFPYMTIDYYVKKLKSKIISCYMGDHFVIIVNDYKNIKEVLARDEFDGRVSAPFLLDRSFGKNLGIFFVDGPKWHEQRRFALRHMRDFGFGRRQEKLESEIMDEMSLLLDIMKNGPIYDEEKQILKGNLAFFPNILHASAGNNIWNIMFGHRFDRSEHDMPRRLCRAAVMLQKANDTTGGAIFQRPFLKYFGNMFGYKNHMIASNILNNTVKKYLEYQKYSMNENDERGFIDRYIKKLNEDDNSNNFTEEQLIILLVDFMFPALSALSGVITHIIKYLMHYPKIMEKVRNEIDNVVGTGRLVTWEDRKDLPYLEAIIRETLRIETITPLSVIHRTLKKTMLGGYEIPANTPIFTNLAAMHHDPELWGDPEVFRPERFLTEDGQLGKDISLPFGFGHRLCAGETYARYNMFGTVALLLQNFNFFFVEGEPSSLEDKDPGLVVFPKDLWIRFESRYPCSVQVMSPFLIVILTFLLVYKLYRFVYDKPPNAPPGIIRIPIGGSYWMLLWGNYKFPHMTIDYYVKKLKSKIISCYFGDQFVVIANDYESIKQVLAREEFDGRVTAPFLLDRSFGKDLGIFFIDGPKWHEQRRFALRHMRDFGFGRRQEKLESEIMDEMSLLLDIMKNGPIYDEEKQILKGNLALFPDILYASSGNNIWNVMFGHRFDRSEHDVPRRLCRAAVMFQRANDTTGGAILQRPFLKYFGNMFGYKNHMKASNIMEDIVKKYLEHQKASVSENDDRGFIDRYLKKLNEEDKTDNFTEEQLIVLLIDIMFPAFSALPGVITHIIKYLVHHPRVMEKVRNEIDNVVGTGRLATWEDRKHLPYLEATIRETMRIETVTPLSLAHRSVKKITLGGYEIPANTAIFTNLAAMHHDPDLWGDPEVFRPERFLKEDGQLGKDISLPFGFGHRLCAGETYARFNLFGTLALLLQNFNFFFVEGEPSSLKDKVPGITVIPKELWIRFELR
ncbi:uncharacterized protein LOC113003430 [Solenopsis invicta]|uniref:uncharacterized protein LOC113003430 n=1 Tax=Solenopsis invicta TaxID=13686 RepID=UPI00193E9DF8|nr:uncharacterized protein LOC113003430 [Solenopsis invicta]